MITQYTNGFITTPLEDESTNPQSRKVQVHTSQHAALVIEKGRILTAGRVFSVINLTRFASSRRGGQWCQRVAVDGATEGACGRHDRHHGGRDFVTDDHFHTGTGEESHLWNRDGE